MRAPFSRLRPFPARAPLFCLFASILLACGDDSPGSTPGPQGAVVLSASYVISGDRIIADFREDTVRSCFGDSLEVRVRPPRKDTTHFELKGDSLFLLVDPGASDSGRVVSAWNHIRQSPGAGVTGLWRWMGSNLRVLEGFLTAREKAFQAKQAARQKELLGRYGYYLDLDGKSLTWYYSDDYSHQFITTWGLVGLQDSVSNASRYDIGLTASGKGTLILKGGKTGSTLRIQFHGEDSTRYFSEADGKPAYTYHRNPRACPNRFSPEWYSEFLEANRR